MEGGGPTRDEDDPRIGTTLDGRYHLLRRLGAGGFGVVYEAEHVLIRRKVAVKMLHAHVAADTDLLARFKREAIAATATGHAHIVEVLDMGRAQDGAAYMVLELLSGRDWAAVLDAEGPQPLGRTVHVVRQVLDALSAAHAKGIVHRDLKAENVFLVRKEHEPHFVKLVDFGISKMREEASADSGRGPGDVAVTHTGMALGTPVSMAPEQFQGKRDVDHRADLWSVGVMLFRALTGRFPFGGETYAMLALNVMTEEPPPVSALRPDVPAAVGAVVARLLEKDRARRFATAEEVRAALEPFEHDESPAPPRGDLERLGLAATAIATAVDSRPRGAVTRGDGVGAASDGAAAAIEPTRVRPAAARAPLALGAAAVALAAAALGAWALGGGPASGVPASDRAAERPARDGAPDELEAEARSGALGPDAGAAPGATAAARAAAPREVGHLILWTTPATLASRDGEPLGLTPLSIDLPAGTHVLTLENPEEEIVTTHEVTIEPGATLRAVLDLSERAPARGGRTAPRVHPPAEGTVAAAATSVPASDPPVVAPPSEPTPAEPPPAVPPAEPSTVDRGGLRRPR